MASLQREPRPEAPEAHPSARNGDIWASVDRMVERMDVRAILAHELGPLAARHWRELGRALPEPLLAEEKAARFALRLATPVLSKARDAYAGRMLLLKGPEIAALYPPGGRHFVDLDVLVDDAPAAQRALTAAGFTEVDDPDRRYVVHHHVAPVVWPGIQLKLELHSAPNWPRRLPAPSNAELFASAVAARVPVDGLQAPAPAQHALLMAAHSWKHMPLVCVRDVLDAAVLAREAEQPELERTAAAWGVARMWRTTAATVTWLFEGGRPPVAVRLWARNLLGPRDATVLERHARRWVAPFWMLPLPKALAAAFANVVTDARPVDGEPWRAKIRRVARIASDPSFTRSEQVSEIREDNRWF